MADFIADERSEGSEARHDGSPEPGSENKIGCGLLGRYPVISIVVFAILGLICGKSDMLQLFEDGTNELY